MARASVVGPLSRLPSAVPLSLVALLGIGACRPVTQPATPHHAPAAAAPRPASWDEVLAEPTDLEVRVEVSAQWLAKRQGLVNLRHPAAKQAGLKPGPVLIDLKVGIVRHPEHGDFLIDSGIDASLKRGAPTGVKWPVKGLLDTLIPIEDLASMRRRLKLDVQGVFLTHTHFDHVLGLPDLPLETPLYVGAKEVDAKHPLGALLRPSAKATFRDRPPLREWTPADGVTLAPFEGVIDVFGDGSVWAIPVPGHTPGSMAYLINAKAGPVLFVGDTSHTQWGWDHGVEPGRYTADAEANAAALDQLKMLVAQHPSIRVVVGHESSARATRPSKGE